MILWLDAQLSPHLAPWLAATFDIEARSAASLGFREATDNDLFMAARSADAIVLTKDADFVRLLERHGPPPGVIWLTSGNTSNEFLRELLRHTLPPALRMIAQGESLVEITSRIPEVS